MCSILAALCERTFALHWPKPTDASILSQWSSLPRSSLPRPSLPRPTTFEPTTVLPLPEHRPTHRGGKSAARCSGCTRSLHTDRCTQANSRRLFPGVFLRLGLRIIASVRSSRLCVWFFVVCCNSLIPKLSNSGCQEKFAGDRFFS